MKNGGQSPPKLKLDRYAVKNHNLKNSLMAK